MRSIKRTVTIFMTLVLMLAATAFSSASADDVSLKITGDGVEKETVITLAELKGMKEQMAKNAYSAWNTWPSQRTYYAEGIPLEVLLKRAGLKDEATTINIAASPGTGGSIGYNQTFLLKDLFTERYTFDGAKTEVPAIMALKLSESGFDKVDDVDLRLIHGQLAAQEQTTVGFVQSVRVITVTCAPVSRLPQPIAEAERLADGQYSIKLSSSNSSAKIYYTTDGSEPTAGSNMYNISAPNWQPQLNVPFTAGGGTQIKAIAVASGFENSAVYSFTPDSLGVDTGKFSDLADFDWARPAIEALAEKDIVSGVGDNRFDPAGGLTRGMFVTMMGRALNDKEGGAAPSEEFRFPDVDYASWYGPHVQWAVDAGIVNGYPDGTFRPKNFLTVEEMNIMASRASGIEQESDGSDVKRQASRAEAAVILHGLLP